jgi:glutamine synthetase
MDGNAYEQVPASLPRYWHDALALFEGSGYIARTFGEDFQRVFTILKQQEMDEFDRRVTSLEYDANL